MSSALDDARFAFFSAAIEHGPVLLEFNARYPDVEVPARYADDEKLVLRLGLGDHHDLDFNEVGVWETLRFSGAQVMCYIPWHSVSAIQSEGSTLAMRCVVPSPIEVGIEVGAEPDEPMPPAEPKRPHLTLVP